MGDVVPEEALNPIDELFVPLQVNEVPVPELGEVEIKLIWLILVPEQTELFEIGEITGNGFTVIV